MAVIPQISYGIPAMDYSGLTKSLSDLGQQVGQAFAAKEYQKQAQAVLPVFQEAMKSFESGDSSGGYSAIVSLAAQNPSNPYVQNLAKLGMMGGQAIDENKYKMAVSNAKTSTGLDQILPILMLTNPEVAEKLSSSLLNKTEPQPSPTEVNPALGDANIPGSAEENPDLPQSETVVNTIEAINQKNKGLDEGKTFGELVLNSEDMVFTPEKLQALKPHFVKIKGLDKYLPGVVVIAVLPAQQLQNKTINISSRSGVSASFTNDPNYQQNTEIFKTKITEYLGLIDSNKPLQEAIKTLGGIDKLSVESGDGAKYKIGNLPKGSKPIKIDKETKDAIARIAALPQAAKNANSPLFGAGVDIPAVGGGKIGQTSVNPKVANAMVQAQKELPNASKDQIIARAKEIAKGL